MYTFFVLQEANFTLCFVFKASVSSAIFFVFDRKKEDRLPSGF